MKRWLIVVAAAFVLVGGYLVWSRVALQVRDHHAANAYDKEYQDRLARIEDSLNKCADVHGKYPASIEKWTAMDSNAPSLVEPMPFAAAPFEIHLELMDHREEVLLIFEPGFAHLDGSGTWYKGYSLFNTPRAFHAPYDADDIARTKAALDKLQRP